MLAIYKKEMRSYVCGMIGCIMVTVILALIGFFTTQINFSSSNPHFEYSLYYAVNWFVFIITIPFITMRSVAEERRSRTEQLLLSLPIPIWKTVLAKYFAMMTLIAIPVAVVSVYPLILKLYDAAGVVNLTVAYGSILMLALLLLAMVAIGMFISSLVESQIIAAITTVAIYFALFFMRSIAYAFPSTPVMSMLALIVVFILLGVIVLAVTKNSTAACIATGIPCAACIVVYIVQPSLFAGLFPDILSELSFFDMYAFGAAYGLFDVTAAVYYVSVAFLFLLFTVLNMERRRVA